MCQTGIPHVEQFLMLLYMCGATNKGTMMEHSDEPKLSNELELQKRLNKRWNHWYVYICNG